MSRSRCGPKNARNCSSSNPGRIRLVEPFGLTDPELNSPEILPPEMTNLSVLLPQGVPTATASQAGADRVGICRYADARIVVFDRCGRRRIRHCDLAAWVAPEVMRSAMPS
jgi:hypothetical protein